ncbi:MAG: hypothetical protein J6Y20_03600 [Lachnospiraceae bacterium]|nr:hypothetical protein [Lachnospiraceae bacterium]
MARITGAADERVFQIQKWLGLNENPDGDTKLKMGEASRMRNFRVTRDGNLQKRPGTKAVKTISAGDSIDAVYTDGQSIRLVICDKRLIKINTDDTSADLKTFTTVDNPHIFAYGGKLYILGCDSDYYAVNMSTTPWSVSSVSGYIPLIAVTVTPSGSNELLEQVNKLTAKRRVWLSPDGSNATFQLPEKDLQSIDSATLTADGSTVTISSSSTANGTVTFSSAPAAGTNTIEVIYTAKASFRTQVTGMKFSETYNGSQDTRVFLYGDGSAKTIYSDVTYDGVPSAEYFPDLNEVKVGVDNSPITGMIRHYGTLAVYKTDGAYSIDYGVVTLADTSIAAAFYVTPVNSTIGNEAPGQVQLVLNSPVTLFGQDVYEWRNSSYYTSNLTRDERQARRSSDRVYDTLHGFDTKNCICFDDNYNQEYYIVEPSTGKALVWNYAADVWYFYTDFPMLRPFSYQNELYYGGSDGRIYHVSTEYYYDSDTTTPTTLNAIDCYWESGAMSFGADFKRKYSAMLWIGMKPESKASVDVSVLTDRSATLPDKNISYALLDFEHIDFSDFTFDTNNRPRMKRLKIKAKKFVFYKLLLSSENNDSGATVTSADFRVRFTGFSK